MILRAIDYVSLTIISKNIKSSLIVTIILMSFNLEAQITSFPYTEDFESGAGGWSAQGTNTSWELGSPSGELIGFPVSGSNAWVTNLSGDYSDNENGWIQSPIFDFTSLASPEIQFFIWRNCEAEYDGVVLQSSVNSGATWENVGSFNDPNNWYNFENIVGTPGGQGVGWSGREETNNGSGGWSLVSHGLPNLIGQSNVVFRLAFGTDTSVTDEGIGFDLIRIYATSEFCVFPDPNAGEDSTHLFCQELGTEVDLDFFLTVSPSVSRSWTSLDGVPIDFQPFVNFEGIGPGVYRFLYQTNPTSSFVCEDTAVITIEITDEFLSPGLNGEITACQFYTEADLFAALEGSPDPGGNWFPEINQVDLVSGVFTYSHPSSPCTAEVNVTIILLNDEGEIDDAEETCYVFESINLNDYLDVDAPFGGSWVSIGVGGDTTKEVPISEGDDVDFPDTGAGKTSYNFTYSQEENCVNYSRSLGIEVTIDPNPVAEDDKRITYHCFSFDTVNLNQYIARIYPNHTVSWVSQEGLTIVQGIDPVTDEETNEVDLPNNGQFLYTFNYTIQNSCGTGDSGVLEIFLDLSNQAIPIPDLQFENFLIDEGIDLNSVPNGEIERSRLCDVTALDIFNYDISNFSGLEYFTELTSFYMENNQAGSLIPIDFSGNTLLKYVYVYDAPNLIGVNINQNPALLALDINTLSNLFNSVNISNNINIEYLNISNSGLTALDLTNNKLLDNLIIEFNPINVIDVSDLIYLKTLETSNTQIERLDVSNNTLLTSFIANDGQLKSVNLRSSFNQNLETLSLINNPNLDCIFVDDVDDALAAIDWSIDPTASYTIMPCGAPLNLKVFLEGAYDTNSGLMRDDMRSSGILPTTSPYVDAKSCDISVFNVTGSSAIVDWIWLELRDITDQTLVIESRSAFLRADGTVVDVDGVSPLFIDVPENDYYLMLSHRNHLGVLTLDSFTFDGTTLNIDLTTSNLSVQGGNNAIAGFSDGAFGLYAGDFNGDGQIQNTDRNGVTPLRGISGYNNADINLNGQVQNSDINGILTPNIGKGEQFMSRNLFAPRRQN
ncbi:hypothetical protein [Psychroserpens jangbogonensis]|uniref:hypothetical protein n=1 Tax=Psychroserpens jangbogonensis TaxID=1484460 RepID=UPI000AE33EC3|nr:hypothetical protein [Psychroserpens jangbogonensis]